MYHPPSVGQVPTRVITILPPTTSTVRRTKIQVATPFRPLRILPASSVGSPSHSRTMLSPSLSFAMRRPRLAHFEVSLRFTKVARLWDSISDLPAHAWPDWPLAPLPRRSRVRCSTDSAKNRRSTCHGPLVQHPQYAKATAGLALVRSWTISLNS